MKKRLQVLFSGRVQGVGFRYTTERLARKFPVTGFVKNLSDGKVELVAEGEEKVVREFLSEIQKAFQPYLHDLDTDWREASGEFTGFGIQF